MLIISIRYTSTINCRKLNFLESKALLNFKRQIRLNLLHIQLYEDEIWTKTNFSRNWTNFVHFTPSLIVFNRTSTALSLQIRYYIEALVPYSGHFEMLLGILENKLRPCQFQLTVFIIVRYCHCQSIEIIFT